MSADDILFEKRGVAGVVTLNRPEVLNALTLGMVRALHPKLQEWADDPAIHHVIITAAGDKAFCAGGDIRKLYQWGLDRKPEFLAMYREEYVMNVDIKRYPKPFIAVMNGINMGGGVGISVHGSHRVATERLMFAMPETGIGLFPDVGGSYFLPRCPGKVGMYMGLTGHRLKAADACYAGVATHYVEAERIAALVDALVEVEDVDACIAQFASDPGKAPLSDAQLQIDQHFDKASVAEIVKSLSEAGDEWSAKSLEILRGKSPTSLEIAFRQLSRGADLSFEDCMRMEFRIVNRIFTGHDFFEGIRAVVIDKDMAPKWQPPTLEEVEGAEIERYFDVVAVELPL